MASSNFFGQKFFEIEDEYSDKVTEVHIAAANIMFAVIKSDGDADRMEIARMVEIMRSEYRLNSEEITNLLDLAERAHSDEQELQAFTDRLCKHWSQGERTKLLNNCWSIATADNEIRGGERSMIAHIAGKLELEEEDVTRANHIAEQRLELNTS